MTATEIAFLALGLLLGIATGAAILIALRAQPLMIGVLALLVAAGVAFFVWNWTTVGFDPFDVY